MVMAASSRPVIPLHSLSPSLSPPKLVPCCKSISVPSSSNSSICSLSQPEPQPQPLSGSTGQRRVAASVAFNPQGNYDLSLLDDDNDHDNNQGNTTPPMPPKQGRFEVVLDKEFVRRLDLSPFHSSTAISSASSVDAQEYLERTIGFTINYERDDPYDQRELSEFPDIRLWFVRLDAAYPWLPVVLDWRAGELARYAAMLIPHQMSMRMGVVFNPEALELFIMKKVFIVYSWLKQQGIPTPKARLKTSDMARMLGFGIGDELFDLIDQHPLSPP